MERPSFMTDLNELALLMRLSMTISQDVPEVKEAEGSNLPHQGIPRKSSEYAGIVQLYVANTFPQSEFNKKYGIIPYLFTKLGGPGKIVMREAFIDIFEEEIQYYENRSEPPKKIPENAILIIVAMDTVESVTSFETPNPFAVHIEKALQKKHPRVIPIVLTLRLSESTKKHPLTLKRADNMSGLFRLSTYRLFATPSDDAFYVLLILTSKEDFTPITLLDSEKLQPNNLKTAANVKELFLTLRWILTTVTSKPAGYFSEFVLK